jgi:hypothetical protein
MFSVRIATVGHFHQKDTRGICVMKNSMKNRIIGMVALCVMVAGSAYAELKDNKNGTITDTSTSLVWLKNANCFNLVSWHSSNASLVPALQSGQCDLTDKSVAGQWRLPTIAELLARAGNTSGFTNVQAYYWSSQNGSLSAYTAQGVNMGGYAFTIGKAENCYLWPVRAKLSSGN